MDPEEEKPALDTIPLAPRLETVIEPAVTTPAVRALAEIATELVKPTEVSAPPVRTLDAVISPDVTAPEVLSEPAVMAPAAPT